MCLRTDIRPTRPGNHKKQRILTQYPLYDQPLVALPGVLRWLVPRHGGPCHRGFADPADAAALRGRPGRCSGSTSAWVGSASPAGSRIASAAWRICRPVRSSSPASISHLGRRWPSRGCFPTVAIVLKRELLFIPVVGWAMATRRQYRGRTRRRGSGPARPGAPGEGRHCRRPLDPDLPRGHAHAGGRRSVPTRSARPPSIASSACRSCRSRSIRGCSGDAASSSNGRGLSTSRCFRPSPPDLAARLSWRPCVSA